MLVPLEGWISWHSFEYHVLRFGEARRGRLCSMCPGRQLYRQSPKNNRLYPRSGSPSVLLPHWRNCLMSSSERSYPVRCNRLQGSAEPCPAESTKRSRRKQCGLRGLYLRRGLSGHATEFICALPLYQSHSHAASSRVKSKCRTCAWTKWFAMFGMMLAIAPSATTATFSIL